MVSPLTGVTTVMTGSEGTTRTPSGGNEGGDSSFQMARRPQMAPQDHRQFFTRHNHNRFFGGFAGFTRLLSSRVACVVVYAKVP